MNELPEEVILGDAVITGDFKQDVYDFNDILQM